MKLQAFKNSLILSIFVHIVFILIFILFSSIIKPYNYFQINLVNGTLSSIHFQFKSKGKSNSISNQETNSEIGTESMQDEILRIQKSIPYPKSALQRGLESDCEWLVTVAENGILENVETTRKCRYEIFNSAFKNIVHQWKFQLPAGTKIRIPVSFRIVDKNE